MSEHTVDSIEALEPAERHAYDFLLRHGFNPRRVPRAATKTPEFEAESASDRYLFEVKARRDDDTLHEIEPGEVVSRSQHLNWSTGILGNLRKATAQLRQHDPHHERFWIAWLAAEAPLAGNAVEEQLRGTLLGIHQVTDLADASETGVTAKDCFYAQRGAFEQFPDIDAAILAVNRGLELWVNEFGRPEQTIASGLGQFFRQNGGLNVPAELDAAGIAFRATLRDNERGDEALKLHLQDRYGLRHPIVLHFKSHMGLGSVPVESLDGGS